MDLNRGQGTTQEAAELFYYLNRTGYNGLCRFNSKGGFNVPFGRYKTINYTRDFTPYSTVLSPWTFTSGDFSKVLVGSLLIVKILFIHHWDIGDQAMLQPSIKVDQMRVRVVKDSTCWT